MGKIFDAKGLRSEYSDLPETQTRVSIYACPCYLQVSQRSDHK